MMHEPVGLPIFRLTLLLTQQLAYGIGLRELDAVRGQVRDSAGTERIGSFGPR